MGETNQKKKSAYKGGSLKVRYEQRIGELVRLQIVFCDEQGNDVVVCGRDLDPGENFEIQNLNWEITTFIV